MPEEVPLVGIEKDFWDALPEPFRIGAFSAYKRWYEEQSFNTTFERSKMRHAYMDAMITGIFMAKEEISA